MPPHKAAVLKASLRDDEQQGLVELSKELRVGPSTLDRIVKELQDEGLLDVSQLRNGRAGRPKIKVRVTELGQEFLRAYDSLDAKPLKSRRSDLRRASADAGYSSRLASRGISPYAVFFELNSLASDLRKFAI